VRVAARLDNVACEKRTHHRKPTMHMTAKTLTTLAIFALLSIGCHAQQPPQPTKPVSKGISLAGSWDRATAESRGGQSGKIDDLVALLSSYGTPEADTAAHPDVVVYEGPVMDGPGACRIMYLTPLVEAEKMLFTKGKGSISGSKAVAPGFPDGLFLHQYDVKVSFYNRLTIITDGAKPQEQVVSLQFKNERENWHPMNFKEVPRDWHTYDYVNTRNRGQPRIKIHTRVNDMRKPGHYIIVNIAFGDPVWPAMRVTPPDWRQINYRPNETSTWYVPEPLIKLILYSTSKQKAQ
jgi:hypothetical protein